MNGASITRLSNSCKVCHRILFIIVLSKRVNVARFFFIILLVGLFFQEGPTYYVSYHPLEQ